MADAAERVFTKVAGGVDPVEFYLVEVAVGDQMCEAYTHLNFIDK